MTPRMARGQCLGGENTRAAYPEGALAQTGPPLPIPGRALQDAGRNEIMKIKQQLYFKNVFLRIKRYFSNSETRTLGLPMVPMGGIHRMR